MNKIALIIILSTGIGVILTLLSALVQTKDTYIDSSKLCQSVLAGVENRTSYGFPLAYLNRDVDQGGCGDPRGEMTWSLSTLLADFALYAVVSFGALYLVMRKKK